MTEYNTGNELGSTDPRDLYDNSQNFDFFSLGPADEYPDRKGKMRSSLTGYENRFQAALRKMGYVVVGAYAAGLVITEYNQVFIKDGEYYRAGPNLVLPYTTTGNWAVDGPKFLTAGDNVLRQDLNNPAAGFGTDLVMQAAGVSARSILDGSPVIRRALDYHVARMASGLAVKIACYGDSTTDGNATTSWVANPVDGSGNAVGNSDHNLTAPAAWPAVLQGVLRDMYGNNNIAVWNAGYTGQRMDNGWALANYDRAVTNNPFYGHPDVAFIDFGLNDIVDGLGVLENHLQQTELLVRKLLKQGTLPVLFSSGPEFRDTDDADQRDNEQISQQINVAKRTICAQFGIPFIDKAQAMVQWLESLNGSDNVSWASLQADALHFSDLGHRFQATYLARMLFPDTIVLGAGQVQNVSFMDSRSNSPIGRNKTFTTALTKFGKCPLINLTAVPSLLGAKSMRCWVWCDAPEIGVAHVTFDNDNQSVYNTAQNSKINVRSITNDAASFNGVPPNVGFLHDVRYGDMPIIVGGLKFGLNLVEYTLPANTAVLQSANVYHGYFKFAEGLWPSVASGFRKDLLRDTGNIYYQSNNTSGSGIIIIRCPEPENLSNAWSWVANTSAALLLNCELSVGYGISIMGGLRGVSSVTPAPIDSGIMLYRATSTEIRLYPYTLNSDGTTAFGTAIATFTADATVKDIRVDLTFDGSGNNVMTIYNGWNKGAVLAAVTFTKGGSMRAPIGGRFGTVYVSLPTNTSGTGFARVSQATLFHY